MKQLDVDVSPPASFINLTLMKTILGPAIMVLFRYELLSSEFWSSDRRTDSRKAQVGSKTQTFDYEPCERQKKNTQNALKYRFQV